MLLRIFLKSGSDVGVLVTKPKPFNARGDFDGKNYLHTIGGKIDKRIIQEWELIEDLEEDSGPPQELPPLL